MNDAAKFNPFASPTPADASTLKFEDITTASPLTEEEQLLATIRQKLAQIRFWILSLGIMLFVLAAFFSIATVIAVASSLEMSQIVSNSVSTFIYLVSAILLVRFFRKIVRFMRVTETRQIEEVYEVESAYWKFLGMITLGSIALFAVIILVGVLIGPTLVRALASV